MPAIPPLGAGEGDPTAASAGSLDALKQELESLISSSPVVVFGSDSCPWCVKVKELFHSLNISINYVKLDQRSDGADLRKLLLQRTGQTSIPNVFVRTVHVGGFDATSLAAQSGRLQQLLDSGEQSQQQQFDYDLIVVGGGSGGLAASKEAAKLGAKVAVLDFVKPSPVGTTWGLGGTCVNVGCIPKKLMHQAALLGHAISDAQAFGWEGFDKEKVALNWQTMTQAIQDHIKGLNWNYRVQLRDKKVDYLNTFGSFLGPHRLKCTDKKGKAKVIEGKKFILAMGLRPKYPGIPGDREFCITSDDLFWLKESPGKTVIVGASYIALECAGFLHGIGLDVTVLVRSILLRGFDQDMAERIGSHMESLGITIKRGYVPLSVECIEDGNPKRLKVTAKSDVDTLELECNTVLLAIGREACIEDLGLESIGVKVNPSNNKVISTNEGTSNPSVYAIGDILDGKPELTPVAIQAGKLLARRMFGGATEQCDYINIPTTVFTPLEYGCCGLSEEDAKKQYSDADIEVFHAQFKPLEFSVPHREDTGYVKLICVKSLALKVVGFHYLGPNAGEVTQGFALPLKLGARKADFDALVGIHPTCAETVTTLSVTKSSGMDVSAESC